MLEKDWMSSSGAKHNDFLSLDIPILLLLNVNVLPLCGDFYRNVYKYFIFFKNVYCQQLSSFYILENVKKRKTI